jgi:hypothetical protein
MAASSSRLERRTRGLEAGGEHWQSRAKRASAPFPASAERALFPMCGSV